jgi:two-component system sensor histidine kinase CpxA
VPVLLATLVGGLVCLLLAHYLSAPMVRLRKAAHAYAAGDFSQRVAPALGRRQDEIVDLARAMDDMAERLDVMLKSQRALLRDVSHELRSPLARVEAAMGLARQKGGNGPELDRIEREVERLNEMIGAILSYSRLQSGMRIPALEAIDLDQLLRETIDDANLEAGRRQVTVRAGELPPAPIQGDPQLLHSALENVLRNAVNHAPEGSSVDVSLNGVADNGSGGLYRIRVRDRGPGVPGDMLEQIFQPFVRAESAGTHGIGLGLAIAQRAVNAHHGSIRAENCPDGGLSVIISLPKRPGARHDG